MKVVHEAVKLVMGAPQEREFKDFTVKTGKPAVRKCIPLTVSYRRVFPIGKTYQECDMVQR